VHQARAQSPGHDFGPEGEGSRDAIMSSEVRAGQIQQSLPAPLLDGFSRPFAASPKTVGDLARRIVVFFAGRGGANLAPSEIDNVATTCEVVLKGAPIPDRGRQRADGTGFAPVAGVDGQAGKTGLRLADLSKARPWQGRG
jgi:hypothetical protein